MSASNLDANGITKSTSASSKVYYHLMLSEEQTSYLSKSPIGFNRFGCFKSLLDMAAKEMTAYKKRGFETTLLMGQVAASEVELSKLWGVSRKTVSKFITALNRLRMVSTESNNRTSIHTIISLSAWIVDDKYLRNPNYVRPNADVFTRFSKQSTPKLIEEVKTSTQQKVEEERPNPIIYNNKVKDLSSQSAQRELSFFDKLIEDPQVISKETSTNTLFNNLESLKKVKASTSVLDTAEEKIEAQRDRNLAAPGQEDLKAEVESSKTRDILVLRPNI